MRLLDGINGAEDELYTFDSIMETKDLNKGLQALERVTSHSSVSFDYFYENYGEDLDIIEKELKDKEKFEDFVQEICRYLGLDDLFPYNDLKEIEKQIKTLADNSHWFVVKQDQKKLKALEIIKKKDIHKTMLSLTQSAEEYNHFIDDVDEKLQLTQEEYDLLKEVLL